MEQSVPNPFRTKAENHCDFPTSWPPAESEPEKNTAPEVPNRMEQSAPNPFRTKAENHHPVKKFVSLCRLLPVSFHIHPLE